VNHQICYHHQFASWTCNWLICGVWKMEC
jgi:hypothetical protein